MKAFFFLKVGDNLKKVARLRVAFRTKHAHMLFGDFLVTVANASKPTVALI